MKNIIKTYVTYLVCKQLHFMYLYVIVTVSPSKYLII